MELTDFDFVENVLFNPMVGKLVAAVLGVLVVIVIMRFTRRSLLHYVTESDSRYRIRKAVSFGGYALAILVVSVVFSDQLGNLTVAFGVAGAGIAFALQEVIASTAGFFAISFANFYRTGDRVEVGGIKGDVIDISILRTTIMEVGGWVNGDLYNGRIVRVANSFVFKAPVYNYSADFPFLWDEIKVPIKYGCDHRLAREVLGRVLDEVVGDYARQAASAWERVVRVYLIEKATVAPMVTLVANDNWMEFTLRYVVDVKQRRVTQDRIFTRVVEEVEATEGRIALASETFQIVETPVFDVRLRDAETAPAQE